MSMIPPQFAHLIARQLEHELLIERLQAANDQLAACALADSLTGLPNRRALLDVLARRLARSARTGETLLIAFVDLDDFKRINDTHGHDAGDRLLAAIARAMQSCHRLDDVTARLGGDEFVVLATVAEGEDPQAAADGLRARLEAATRGHFDLEGLDIDYWGPSIGVTTVVGGQMDPRAALASADAAMYAVKRARKKVSRPPGKRATKRALPPGEAAGAPRRRAAARHHPRS